MAELSGNCTRYLVLSCPDDAHVVLTAVAEWRDLVKPFAIDQLVALVTRVLARSVRWQDARADRKLHQE